MNKLQEARREKLDLIRDLNTLALQEETNARDRVKFMREEQDIAKAETREEVVDILFANTDGNTIADRFSTLVSEGKIGISDVPENVFEEMLKLQGESLVDTSFRETIDGQRILFQQDKSGNIISQIDLGVAGTPSGGGINSGFLDGEISYEQLTPLAKAVVDGTLGLSDLTATIRGQIAPELNAVGYTKAVTGEMKQEVNFIINQMDIVMDKWNEIPNRFKGFIQGRVSGAADLESQVPQIAAFNTSAKIVGMTLTRLFEKGRISDQDRIFYLNQMPKLTNNKKSAQANVAELKRILGARISNNISELTTGEVNSTVTDDNYLDQLAL